MLSFPRLCSRTLRIPRHPLLCAIFCSIGLFSSAFAQTAPALVSVNPADGATQVATTSPLVFVFDQAMDTNSIILQSTASFAGTLDVVAPGFNQFISGTWTDDRTLSVGPAIQWPYATFTWTLNPTGSFVIFRIKSKSGVNMPTVSGTFTTGIPVTNPILGLTFPANNATGVGIDTVVEFRFNMPMRKDPAIGSAIVWGGTGINTANFNYTWSADGRSLFCDYIGNYPKNTIVNWALNPSAAPVKLQSDTGLPLASDTYSGMFITGSATPGCDPSGLPLGWGSYGVTKRSDFRQLSDTEPVSATNEASFVFSAFFSAGATTNAITSGSITLPDGTSDPLTIFGSTGSFFETAANEPALNAAYPPGNYVLRFTRTGGAEHAITLAVPQTGPPIPRIANFSETQSINAGADFTLRWDAFAGAGPDDFISLYLTDTNGNVVFQAPDFCVPRPLAVTDTSIVIPGNTLLSNRTYQAAILFSHMFYNSTNEVPKMAGYGNIIRNTYFTVKTGGGNPVTAIPSRLADFRLLPNGNPEFTLTGTVGISYLVQRTSSLATRVWTEVRAVVIGATGKATFEDTTSPKSLPLFYRVVAN